MSYNLITNNNGVNRDIKYINRNFSEMRSTLIDFSKTYFPTTFTDFSPSSPGMMFIEMASYVGDVMAFYSDNQIQENFIQYAQQLNNLYDLAYMSGYKPSVTSAAVTTLDIYQTVPAITVDGSSVPDYRYTLIINEDTPISNPNNTTPFLTQNRVDFSQSSSLDPTTVSVYQISSNVPVSFLLKKSVQAISATINTTTFTAGSPTQFATYTITAPQILGILDVIDSDGNEWVEVDYLAQETVFETIQNTNPFGPDPNTSADSGEVGSLLRLKKVPRRFVSRFTANNTLIDNTTTLQLQFGAGTTNNFDEQIIPNPDNVGIGLPYTQNKLTTAYSPTNFMFDKTYGIAPSNTTLTVRYLTGGGVTSNVSANSLTNISNTNVRFTTDNLDTTLAQSTFTSLEVTNPIPATGGGDGDSVQDIRLNSLANYASQLRSVTQEDYIVRTYSLPSQYGSIAKAYIETPRIGNLLPGETASTLDLYILAYDGNGYLTNATSALKQNLSTYLSQYRMIGDSIKIKDAFIINIGVNFEIVVLPNFNSNQVLTDCINKLQSYFKIDNMQVNQPILINELYSLLLLGGGVKGVQNVKNIEIVNKVGENLGYSKYAYSISGATQDRVVYPSQDPSIFEVKYPNIDIKGRVLPI
jgi:hypothetical protein